MTDDPSLSRRKRVGPSHLFFVTSTTMPRRRCQSCCVYGPLLAIPSFTAFAGTLLTWVGSWDCTFFVVHPVSVRKVDVAYGLWTVQTYSGYDSSAFGNDFNAVVTENTCSFWGHHNVLSRDDIDAPLMTAQVVSYLICATSLPLMVAMLLPYIGVYSTGYFRTLSVLMVVQALVTLLTLVALTSRWCDSFHQCGLGFAGICMMCAFASWIISAVSSWYMRIE